MSDEYSREVNRERIGRTLEGYGIGWGMNRGSNGCRCRTSQGAMRWGSQRRYVCKRRG